MTITEGRRDRRKRQTRATLSLTALRMVAEHGLDHVTVDEISEAAGVSPRTFFNYFTCKDAAVIGDVMVDEERLVARLTAVPADLPVVAVLRAAFAELVEDVQADRDLWCLRMQVVERNPALLSRLVTIGVRNERTITAAIAARLGLPDDHPYPSLVAAVTGAALRACLGQWARGDGARPLTTLVDEAFAALAAGLPEPRRP
ncbi:acyl-CoA-like ligand-binding transcription factor [Micromonospora sagamiensis]|uniref:TetR family transcriptional regulator n=1 Tax=Micromonospora sagamiensis TaxID=47875 RepID=A0A562WFQ0_9ACTN|nr:TetR family transcriptional regulator [Micromonospora sagamiensis]TWJ29100.1 TetR family transcriptional regulator [Micromonospora sagamiensis]BCL17875.1 TetR family transcriptional regulator [Micromonospora sagamiensis]